MFGFIFMIMLGIYYNVKGDETGGVALPHPYRLNIEMTKGAVESSVCVEEMGGGGRRVGKVGKRKALCCLLMTLPLPHVWAATENHFS